MSGRKLRFLLMGVVGSLCISYNVYAESYATVKQPEANIVQSPNAQSPIVTKVNKHNTIKIIKQIEDWYEIEINNSISYINIEDVDVFKVKAKISKDNVDLKAYPDRNDLTLRKFKRNDIVSVYYKVGDWYNVSLGDQPIFGFVHKSEIEDSLLYLTPSKDISQVKKVKVETPKVSKEEPKKASNNSKSTQVVEYAKRFIGNPYRYGGTSLTNGADCSGFTQQVMKSVGVSLNRSSAAQYAGNGIKVSKNNIQPGDLLFYGYNGRVSHVALYIGNNQVIHANDYKTGITTGAAFPTRGKPFIGAKRVL